MAQKEDTNEEVEIIQTTEMLVLISKTRKIKPLTRFSSGPGLTDRRKKKRINLKTDGQKLCKMKKKEKTE